MDTQIIQVRALPSFRNARTFRGNQVQALATARMYATERPVYVYQPAHGGLYDWTLSRQPKPGSRRCWRIQGNETSIVGTC